MERDAYSHEVTAVGLWFGSRETPFPGFFAYTYPAPEGIGDIPVAPEEAFWNAEGGLFNLPYDAVRTADDPDESGFGLDAGDTITVVFDMNTNESTAVTGIGRTRHPIAASGASWRRKRSRHKVLPSSAARSTFAWSNSTAGAGR